MSNSTKLYIAVLFISLTLAFLSIAKEIKEPALIKTEVLTAHPTAQLFTTGDEVAKKIQPGKMYVVKVIVEEF